MGNAVKQCRTVQMFPCSWDLFRSGSDDEIETNRVDTAAAVSTQIKFQGTTTLFCNFFSRCVLINQNTCGRRGRLKRDIRC